MDLEYFSNSLRASYADENGGDDITELALWYIEEMRHYRKLDYAIALDMLTASIHIVAADGGDEALELYAEHLRAMARRLEIRINRHRLSIVPDAINDDH